MIKITDKSKTKYLKYFPENTLPPIKNFVSDVNFVQVSIVDFKIDEEVINGEYWELFDKKLQILIEFYNRCVSTTLYRTPILFHTQLPNFIPTLTDTMIDKYCEYNPDKSFDEAKIHLELLFELAKDQSWEVYCFYDKWSNEIKQCKSIESLKKVAENAFSIVNNYTVM